MLKEGSYAALARAITEASREGERDGRKAPRDVIDRRKLRSLVNGGNGAVLTVDDLFALDHYLSRFGESLAARPLLQKPDLMDALSTSGRVTFLLGSKHEAERGMVSEYDLHGMGEIQRSIGRSSEVGVSYDVQTVPLHPEPEATRKLQT